MKKSEYLRLAKLSLRQRKNSSRWTVAGLAFGFIVLIPMFVALVGINVSFERQLREKPFLLNYEIAMSDYRVETDENSVSGHIDELSDVGTGDAIVYEQYVLTGTGAVNEFIIDGREPMSIPWGGEPNHINIVDIDKSVRVFPKNLTETFDGGIFAEGFEQGFTGDGKKQVVLSQNFLKLCSLTPEDVYLKPVSIRSAETGTGGSSYLCRDYIVVGILKAEVFDAYSISQYMRANAFFTSANVYDQNGAGVLKPRYVKGTDGKKELKYDNIADKDALNEEWMMLAWPSQYSFGVTAGEVSTYSSTKIYFEEGTFKDAVRGIAELSNKITAILGEGNESGYVILSEALQRLILVDNIIGIASLICAVVGLVLLSSALINLFVTIYHSVSQRRFYLTMLRAIGARNDVIPKLYVTEAFLIASRANIFIAIFGTGLGVGIKLVIDWILKNKNIAYSLSVPWAAVFVAVLCAMLFLYAVTTLYAYVCSKKLSKRKMTDVLNGR